MGDTNLAPCKGQNLYISQRISIFIRCILKLLPLQGALLTDIIPRALPWAKSFCPFRACCLSHLPWAKGSSEGPKREATRLQTLLRMIKKRKLLIFEKHQRKETFFEKNPVPQNADEYLTFIGKEYDFLKKRNRRILNFKINM